MKYIFNPRIFIPATLVLFTCIVVLVYIIGIGDKTEIPLGGVIEEKSEVQLTQLLNSTTTNPLDSSSFLLESATTAPMLEYKNNLLGLQFSYPVHMGKFVNTRDGSCIVAESKVNFCVEAHDNASNIPLEELFNDQSVLNNKYYNRIVKEKLIVDGHSAYLVSSTNPYNSDNSPLITELLILGDRNTVLEISGTNIPREIISSIKFFVPTIDLTPYTLDITWNNKRVEEKESAEDIESRSCVEGESYSIGIVQNGVFKGDKIIARNQQYCGMDCGGRSENELYYYVYHLGHQIPVGPDTSYPLNGLGAPNKILVPNSSYVLKKDFASGFFDDEEIGLLLFTDATAGKVFDTDYTPSCFVIELNDHALVYYSLDIPFINKENGELNVTLANGKKFNESYDLDSDWTCLPVVPEPKNLHIVAYNSISEPLYALDNNDEKLKELYNEENTMAAYQKLALSYQQFLDIYPLLYWKDPVGRWIELKNKKYLIAAEKCKPVIYLYPEEKMDVSVYVKPNGGFTHTIPEYHDGWHVTAFPDGTIVDKTSSITYPYLYWAGWSIDVPKITKGWIVDRGNLESFLKDKLAQLGLSKKEIFDFNEYWVTRLREDGAPQYKIMFLDQEEFNQLAPLRIEGEKRPDHIIRVVMYAQAAHGNEILPAQILSEKPSRDGFTVVEWGGSLLK
jgi:hypothetical protein